MEDLFELIQQTSDRIYALRERISEVLRQDFPSETPQLMARLLLQLVDKVDDRLRQQLRGIAEKRSLGARWISRRRGTGSTGGTKREGMPGKSWLPLRE